MEDADVLALEIDIFESRVPILAVEEKSAWPADFVGSQRSANNRLFSARGRFDGTEGLGRKLK